MSRIFVLWSLLAVQGLCCAYFLADVLGDFVFPSVFVGLGDSDFIEALVTIALFLGFAFTVHELRQVLSRQTHLEDQIRVASGAFTEVLEARFHAWSLTAAEREVAILAIKGFSISEMAKLRDTKQGTIKAQCASLYRKADVGSRLQLLSVFLDDLMEEGLVQDAGQTAV